MWFTVTCTPWDPKNEPTTANVAATIAAYAVATPLILVTAGTGVVGAAALGGFMANTASGGATTASAGGDALSFSVVGAKRDGVYSDGSTLAVRGKLNDAAAYALYYAADEELRARPYSGPPSAAEAEALRRALVAMKQELAAVASAAASPEAIAQLVQINSCTQGIQVKNETAVPLLVILSQLTPLHWERVDPGQVFNLGNRLGVGRVWFTVSVSLYDERNVPTMAGVGVQLVAVSAAFFTPLGPVGAALFGTASAVASVRGVIKTGVYADGKLLTVRGMADSRGDAYLLHFAEASEVAAHPWAGPPSAEQMRRVQDALTAVGSARAAGAGGGAGAAAMPQMAVVDVRLDIVAGERAGIVIMDAGSGGAELAMPAFTDTVVKSVTAGSAAEAAGVRAGASLTFVNGQDVSGLPFAQTNELALAALTSGRDATLAFRLVAPAGAGGGGAAAVSAVGAAASAASPAAASPAAAAAAAAAAAGSEAPAEASAAPLSAEGASEESAVKV